MNKYIINEDQMKLIRENVEIQNVVLPKFITDSIDSNKTSLGKHPTFPPEDIEKFENKILKKRYYELLNDLKKIDDVNGDVSKKNLITLLSEYVNKCKKIEEPIRRELEKICLEQVYELFGLTQDDANIECAIVDKVDSTIPREPKLTEDEYDDVKHIDSLTDEVMKRRLINSLIQGSCVRLSTNYEKILSKIYSLNPKLIELYHNINAINEYLSFVKEQIPSKDTVGGVVYVDLTEDLPSISSEAIIFPTLMFETVKGVMELISSAGLPDSARDAEYVIGKADFMLAESWDKRLGVGLWDMIMGSIGYENSDIMPLVFSEIVSLKMYEFNDTLREIFANTKKGKQYVKDIVNNIRKGNQFDEINDAVSIKTNNDDGDEFFSPEDLIKGLNETDTTSVGDYTYDAPMFGDDETLDHSNMIAKSIQESKDYYDFFDVNHVYDTIQEFLSDKHNNITRKKWRTIPFEQYRNALVEFMRYGGFMRFPTKYIDQWADIVTNNTLSIQAITELAGHTQDFPYDDFCDAFGFERGDDEYEKFYGNYEECFEYLEELGFYDWSILPDGSDAWSDYGLDPLYKLIMELEEQTTPEQKIVVINKILDVYHQRGDLASAFIEGGTKSLSQISN